MSWIDFFTNSSLYHRCPPAGSAVACSPLGLGFLKFWRRSAVTSSSLFSLLSGTPARPCWELPTLSSVSSFPPYFSSLSLSCPPSDFPGYILACALRRLLFQFNNHTFYFCTSISFDLQCLHKSIFLLHRSCSFSYTFKDLLFFFNCYNIYLAFTI